jgi:hypothetical protein
MICPGTQNDCDNPGCRHGGCQGRLPQLPLFQAIRAPEPATPAQQPIAAQANFAAKELERIAA